MFAHWIKTFGCCVHTPVYFKTFGCCVHTPLYLHQLFSSIQIINEQVKGCCCVLVAIDGVVLATEKKQKSILYDDQTIHKVEQITQNVGMVYSGMGPDYRYRCQIAFSCSSHNL